MGFPSDLEIARKATAKPLPEIAAQMGIGAEFLEPYGKSLAKISLDAIDSLKSRPKAKYVVVTAITPTPLGEGKTTTTVGLGQAMKHIGKKRRSVCVNRAWDQLSASRVVPQVAVIAR